MAISLGSNRSGQQSIPGDRTGRKDMQQIQAADTCNKDMQQIHAKKTGDLAAIHSFPASPSIPSASNW
jgi:hypothetical protein